MERQLCAGNLGNLGNLQGVGVWQPRDPRGAHAGASPPRFSQHCCRYGLRQHCSFHRLGVGGKPEGNGEANVLAGLEVQTKVGTTLFWNGLRPRNGPGKPSWALRQPPFCGRFGRVVFGLFWTTSRGRPL